MPESGKDEGLDFEAGAELGREEALEELESRLVDEEGFDPEEVEELLYDPAPRRRRGRRRKTRRTYDPDPRRRGGRGRRRTYDPESRVRKYGKRAKGMLGKLKKFAMPGAAGLTFYGAYLKRAEDLFAAGSISEKSVFQAVQYDLKNFNGSDAMGRVQKQVGEIAAPLIGGWAVKQTKIAGKYSGLVGDILSGLGIGIGLKALLDPPVEKAKTKSRSGNGAIKVIAPSGQTAMQERQEAPQKNPYEKGGY